MCFGKVLFLTRDRITPLHLSVMALHYLFHLIDWSSDSRPPRWNLWSGGRPSPGSCCESAAPFSVALSILFLLMKPTTSLQRLTDNPRSHRAATSGWKHRSLPGCLWRTTWRTCQVTWLGSLVNRISLLQQMCKGNEKAAQDRWHKAERTPQESEGSCKFSFRPRKVPTDTWYRLGKRVQRAGLSS